MTILIKGMEMPECCDKCWAISVYGDYPVCLITGETRGYNFRIRERRMDKCPLVEVPTPHGRLIDDDALNHEYYKSPSYLNLCNAINAAPTVIEAEEGER